MTQPCYPVTLNGNTCIQCDAVAGVVGVPEQRYVEPIYGWNASARSSVSQRNDCYVEFDQPFVVGAVVGFAEQHVDSNPAQVQHGFYFFESAGAHWYAVVESGVTVAAQTRRQSEQDIFRIERVNGRVRYYVNNGLAYSSAAAHARPVIIVACLYASNDGVG